MKWFLLTIFQTKVHCSKLNTFSSSPHLYFQSFKHLRFSFTKDARFTQSEVISSYYYYYCATLVSFTKHFLHICKIREVSNEEHSITLWQDSRTNPEFAPAKHFTVLLPCDQELHISSTHFIKHLELWTCMFLLPECNRKYAVSP